MSMQDLVREINSLPLDKKILIVEGVLKAIREQDVAHSMQTAADRLYDDYAKDKDLTAFSQLDSLEKLVQ